MSQVLTTKGATVRFAAVILFPKLVSLRQPGRTMDLMQDIEREFPLADDLVYLNHAAVSPWPARTAAAVARFAEENAHLGARRYADWLQVGLQMAYSDDGRTGWVQTVPWIHERDDFMWTKREIRSVAVLAEEDTVRLWFAGDELYTLDDQGQQQWHLERWGIGASVCDRN